MILINYKFRSTFYLRFENFVDLIRSDGYTLNVMHGVGHIGPDAKRNVDSIETAAPLATLLDGSIKVTNLISSVRMAHFHPFSKHHEQHLGFLQSRIYLLSPILTL